jgi:outer membrane protein
MKKVLLAAIAAVAALSANAQNFKFGHINGTEVVALMPERDSAEAKFIAYVKELEEQVETLQVEYNNKLNTYQQKAKTWSDIIRESKEKELQDLAQRVQEFQASAQQELQKQQSELLRPVIEKAANAVKKVGKDNGFTYIFDTSNAAVAYWDEATSIDVMDLVKKELKITKSATPARAR